MADNFQIALNCVKTIPEFDGTNISQLPEFIDAVETLLPMYNALDDQFKPILFRAIKNKCTGRTRDAINANQTATTTWTILKNILKEQFGERKTVVELMDKLKTLQLNGTIESFYYKIKKILSRINNRRLTHDESYFLPVEIKRAGMMVFKNHLPEPSRTMIFSRNPSELDEAYKIILEARHQHYTQFGPPNAHNNNTRTNFSDNNRFRNRKPNFKQNYNSNNNYSNRNTNNMRDTNQNQNSNHNGYNNYQNRNVNNVSNYQNNDYNTCNRQHNQSANTRQTSNRKNFNNYHRINNNNGNNNNHNQYNNNNNQNRVLSQNTRRTLTNNRPNLDEIEPMEIGQQGANFLEQASNSYLT